jgi:cyclophilin family peptidyl-prolyl cis-trans isomerase
MEMTTLLVALFSILIPTKTWYAPGEPLLINVDAGQPVNLVMTDFVGRREETDAPSLVESKQQVDVRAMFPAMRTGGCYVLYAVPRGRTPLQYIGTPLVIQLRADLRPGSPPGPLCIKVEPLCTANITTDVGTMRAAFYYDVAPNTVANFISLARGSYYDGLSFHRIVPGFVIQGGDPVGTGAGGPGYQIEAEFNDRPHLRGVLSMAREGDPLEPQLPPRAEYANSAGSQFFVCLDYRRTKHLDRKYTAFGALVDGLDVLDKLGASELADPPSGRPVKPPVIRKVEIVPVKADSDPYPALVARLQQPAGNDPATVQTRPAETQPSSK